MSHYVLMLACDVSMDFDAGMWYLDVFLCWCAVSLCVPMLTWHDMTWLCDLLLPISHIYKWSKFWRMNFRRICIQSFQGITSRSGHGPALWNWCLTDHKMGCIRGCWESSRSCSLWSWLARFRQREVTTKTWPHIHRSLDPSVLHIGPSQFAKHHLELSIPVLSRPWYFDLWFGIIQCWSRDLKLWSRDRRHWSRDLLQTSTTWMQISFRRNQAQTLASRCLLGLFLCPGFLPTLLLSC